jgi:hypothetical protein
MLFRKLAPTVSSSSAAAVAATSGHLDTANATAALGSALELMVPVLEKEFDQGRKNQILEAFSLWWVVDCVGCLWLGGWELER